MTDKFVVIMFNCAHPSGEPKPFLMTDDDDNTMVFDTEDEAKTAANDASWGPFACGVIDLSQITVHFSR